MEAADGQEALSVLAQRHVDVVISDLCMEPMDGVEFTRRLRTPRNGLNPYVPVLMVSGHTEAARVRDAIAAGVTEFLAKPLVPANLEARLLAIVRSPKKRISSKSYCGPDRRRSTRDNPKGPKRRSGDKTSDKAGVS
jgi:CheY-like chemotaxis protein